MLTYKTDRIKSEYESSAVKDALKRLCRLAAAYAEARWQRDIVITDLIRTQAEQDAIYLKSPQAAEYKAKPWKSVHQEGRGADLRVQGWSQAEIAELLEVLNRVPYRAGSASKTAICHDVGAGLHFHVQVA